MKKIILHSYQLGSRGTEICLYKYAKYLREFLGVDPIIVSTSSRPTPTLDRFKKEFKTYLYDSVWKPDGQNYEIRKYFNNLIEKEGVDFLYAIKGGEDDGILRNLYCKTGAHAIFRMDEPHGDVYAGVCEYISQKHGKSFPWVDHIVDYKKLEKDENFRDDLDIPKDALVGFRHGGNETFNLAFVYESIKKALYHRKDLWFIFMNTNKFIDHPRVKFLPWSGDLEYILKFVNTGDFFMHARYDGEIFPLTCAEASTQNKPIITWNPDVIPSHYDTGHIKLLNEKGIYYKNSQDLYNILINLDRQELLKQNWDIYGETYSPKNVINQFKNVFLED
jgi:hypothetical protein